VHKGVYTMRWMGRVSRVERHRSRQLRIGALAGACGREKPRKSSSLDADVEIEATVNHLIDLLKPPRVSVIVSLLGCPSAAHWKPPMKLALPAALEGREKFSSRTSCLLEHCRFFFQDLLAPQRPSPKRPFPYDKCTLCDQLDHNVIRILGHQCNSA